MKNTPPARMTWVDMPDCRREYCTRPADARTGLCLVCGDDAAARTDDGYDEIGFPRTLAGLVDMTWRLAAVLAAIVVLYAVYHGAIALGVYLLRFVF